MKKRNIFVMVAIALTLLITSQPASASKRKLALIAHDITNPFTAFFKQGGEDAAKLVGAELDFLGTTQIDMSKQVAIFENAVQKGYDGIGTTMMDPKAFSRAVSMAQSKNVAVVSYNMDGNWGKRSTLAYSGSDLYLQGYEIGKRFFKDVMKGKGKYILVPALANLDVLIWRMDGIKKAAAEFPGIELITTIEIGTDLVKAFSVVENAYSAHPDVNAFIGTDFFSEAMANFIGVRRLKGKVFGACFDITPGILKHLNKGNVQMTTDQNPYLQGFYAVMQMHLILDKGQPGLEINTGSTVVTQDNMQPFLAHYGMGK
jgi:simple sugar transport system substrate-binding protein